MMSLRKEFCCFPERSVCSNNTVNIADFFPSDKNYYEIVTLPNRASLLLLFIFHHFSSKFLNIS